MTESNGRVVVMGAGPAGLTAASELVKHGRRPVVVEANPEYVDGLALTVQYRGFRFGIGGHRQRDLGRLGAERRSPSAARS